MEAICSSETSVDIHRTTRRYTPEDSTLNKFKVSKTAANLLFTISDYVKSNRIESNPVESSLTYQDAAQADSQLHSFRLLQCDRSIQEYCAKQMSLPLQHLRIDSTSKPGRMTGAG
jgi:hypothetical protein